MSRVTCHMSGVTCHVSDKKKKKLQSGEASLGRVCYQRGLPRLVFEPMMQFSNPSGHRIS